MLALEASQKQPRTKEEFVYEILRAAIMRCDLKPGEKLVIDTLSAQIGVSPIPIRAALQRLQAEGLVEITPHTGTTVSKISPDTVTEIFTLLEALERVAFQVAVPRASAAEIAQLRHFVNEMDKALQEGDANRWSDINNQFHLTLAGIANMKMLLEFTSRTLDSWDRLRRYYLKPFISLRMAEAQAEHRQMMDLIEQRDVDSLVALVAKHNHGAKEAYQNLIKNPEG